MNNLEQASRLAASFPQQSDLLQSRSVYLQLQSEMRADLSVKNSLPMRRHGYGLAEDTGRRFVTVQTTVPKFGLSDSLSGQLTISCFVSAAIPQTKPRRTDGFSYMKNGILVHHTERAITSKDVENALAEEWPVHLLDVNILIALAWDAHEHHVAAHAWFSMNAMAGFATCHVTQSGFLRVSLTPKFGGIPCEEVIQKLKSLTSHPNHRFWNDGPVQTNHSIWSSVTGHNQVPDTNLYLIARQNQGKLVTFDGAIRNRVDRTEREWIEVIAAWNL